MKEKTGFYYTFDGVDATLMPASTFVYVVTDKGAYCWTKYPDADGYFYSFVLKPAGKGARSGKHQGMYGQWRFSPRLTARRKSRSACRTRSLNLARGLPISYGVKKKKPRQDQPPGSVFCLPCSKYVVGVNMKLSQTKNGREILKGKCPECGCKVQKYARIRECTECGQVREMAANDYICKECRAQS